MPALLLVVQGVDVGSVATQGNQGKAVTPPMQNGQGHWELLPSWRKHESRVVAAQPPSVANAQKCLAQAKSNKLKTGRKRAAARPGQPHGHFGSEAGMGNEQQYRSLSSKGGAVVGMHRLCAQQHGHIPVIPAPVPVSTKGKARRKKAKDAAAECVAEGPAPLSAEQAAQAGVCWAPNLACMTAAMPAAAGAEPLLASKTPKVPLLLLLL